MFTLFTLRLEMTCITETPYKEILKTNVIVNIDKFSPASRFRKLVGIYGRRL